jgi:hypothetical protein
MRNSFAALVLAALGLAIAGSPANAESIMKACGDQWKAAKAARDTSTTKLYALGGHNPGEATSFFATY